MPAAILVKGAIIVVPLVITTAVVISQTPFGQDVRRKLARFAYTLGDELNPNRRDPQEPRFNRPEDAEGFMEPHHGGEMDADDESRRRQREELMHWNAIKLQNLERQRAARASQDPTGDGTLRTPARADEDGGAYQTGAEVQQPDGGLRHRGESSRVIMDGTSLYSNPFADENNLDSDGDARIMAPEEDEIDDIDTESDLRDTQKPAHRVLAAASDYPTGEYFTSQLRNLFEEADSDRSIVEGTALPDASSPSMRSCVEPSGEHGLEHEAQARVTAANLAYREIERAPASPSDSSPTSEAENPFQPPVAMSPPPAPSSKPPAADAHHRAPSPATRAATPLHDAHPFTEQERRQLARLHEQNTQRPLPSDQEERQLDRTSAPLVLQTAYDNESFSFDDYNDDDDDGAPSPDDCLSMDEDGVSTPGTWTEVGSVVSEDDAFHP